MAARAKATNGSKPRPIPNAMGRARTARKIKERLTAVQEVRTEIEGMQIAGESKPTDAVPGIPPRTDDDGTILYEDGAPVFVTFGELYAENDAAQARVWAWAERENCTDLVTKMIKIDAEREELGEENHA